MPLSSSVAGANDSRASRMAHRWSRTAVRRDRRQRGDAPRAPATMRRRAAVYREGARTADGAEHCSPGGDHGRSAQLIREFKKSLDGPVNGSLRQAPRLRVNTLRTEACGSASIKNGGPKGIKTDRRDARAKKNPFGVRCIESLVAHPKEVFVVARASVQIRPDPDKPSVLDVSRAGTCRSLDSLRSLGMTGSRPLGIAIACR